MALLDRTAAALDDWWGSRSRADQCAFDALIDRVRAQPLPPAVTRAFWEEANAGRRSAADRAADYRRGTPGAARVHAIMTQGLGTMMAGAITVGLGQGRIRQ